jgi:hypothetical protein
LIANALVCWVALPIVAALTKETDMQTTFFHRTVSLSLAGLLTLAMLGGVDHLSQQRQPATQWAQHTTVHA